MCIHPSDVAAADRRHREFMRFIEDAKEPFRLLSHPPCRTSAESAAARADAGAPGSVGAKALIVRTSEPVGFTMAVIPGDRRLCNERLRALIGRFRFATRAEIDEVTAGLEPGMIPPFGRPVCPGVLQLLVDASLPALALLGFNAAHLERSVVMGAESYMRLVPAARVADISGPAPVG